MLGEMKNYMHACEARHRFDAQSRLHIFILLSVSTTFDYDFDDYYFDYYYFDVFWMNSLCGKDAAEEIHLVVKTLTEIDKNCLVDLECKIRFLT